MENFNFSLEKVLNFEYMQKGQIEKNLAEVLDKIFQIEQEINLILIKVADVNNDLKQKMQDGTETNTIIMYRAYLNNLSNNLSSVRREKQKQEFFKREITIQLKQKNTEIKKIEKLKEKQIKEFLSLQQKKQELFIEEFMATKRHFLRE